MIAKIKRKFPLQLEGWVWRLLDHLAKEVSSARTKMNEINGSYAEGTERYRDNEAEVSYNGVLGELLHIVHIFKEDIDDAEIVWMPLIDVKPVVGPDAVINEKNVDAKLSKKYYQCKYTGELRESFKLQVNADSHDNVSKSVDEYFFVQADVNKKEADVYVVDYTDVNSWEQKQYITPTLEADIPKNILLEDYWDDEDNNS